MIISTLKYIYYKLPPNLRVLVRNVYYSINPNKIHVSPDHFPVNYKKNIDLPIFGRSEKEGYFYRYYQEKAVILNLSPEDLFKYKYEIIYGTYYKNEQLKFQCKEDSVLPISMESHKDMLRITRDDKLTDEIKNLPPKKLEPETCKKIVLENVKEWNNRN